MGLARSYWLVVFAGAILIVLGLAFAGVNFGGLALVDELVAGNATAEDARSFDATWQTLLLWITIAILVERPPGPLAAAVVEPLRRIQGWPPSSYPAATGHAATDRSAPPSRELGIERRRRNRDWHRRRRKPHLRGHQRAAPDGHREGCRRARDRERQRLEHRACHTQQGRHGSRDPAQPLEKTARAVAVGSQGWPLRTRFQRRSWVGLGDLLEGLTEPRDPLVPAGLPGALLVRHGLNADRRRGTSLRGA